MYSKSEFNFIDNSPMIFYYKNSGPIKLTRAQGFKYWAKYFPDYYDWQLPLPLQDAINRDCVSFGEFVDKNGELVGYEG